MEWSGGDFSIHRSSVVLLVCNFCMFLYLYFLHICVFLHFCFSSEWSEVKWSGGEVISVFTTGSHLSGSEMGREDFSTD